MMLLLLVLGCDHDYEIQCYDAAGLLAFRGTCNQDNVYIERRDDGGMTFICNPVGRSDAHYDATGICTAFPMKEDR